MADVYVVTGTQLNRRVKVDDEWDAANIPRGTEFSEGDTFSDDDPGVTAKEIKRWLGLRPRVLVAKAELEEAQQRANDTAATIADLQAQLAAANQALAAAVASGAATPDAAAGSSSVPGPNGQPAGNASADDWRAYAKTQDPERDPAEIDATSRDDLRTKYGS